MSSAAGAPNPKESSCQVAVDAARPKPKSDPRNHPPSHQPNENYGARRLRNHCPNGSPINPELGQAEVAEDQAVVEQDIESVRTQCDEKRRSGVAHNCAGAPRAGG